jgi:cytochrome c oxidase assembly factor CtaG
MTRPWAGQLEHLIYLLVGYQFFALVIGDEPMRWRLSMPAKELLLAIAMGVDTFTGVILLQSSTAIAMVGMSPQHVDPLAQTRLGGAIMWVGGDAIMAVVMISVAIAWFRSPEYRRVESRGWLARVRAGYLADKTDVSTTSVHGQLPRDVDTDENSFDAYNRWLERLSHDR